ncbi:hypothetical protein BB561_005285 [Smittium simulii]|uniref:Uncharacterized protein n=1 Tax=Smittium simulii TaxID=133385 RepID=A0A2T9YB52_9FUNG|nr:hypothetical protein BB561_005285 [Smittium simulii]
MNLPRIVPWASAAEFSLVAQQIYSSTGDRETDIKARREGLQTIKVWICRAKLPTTILVTAQLLETWLLDHEQNLIAQSNCPMSLRLNYSMSLIRFVNLLVDVEQKSYYASSIMILAEKLGIPVWLVELRHAATHEKLPGIEMLRLANKQALSYLYHNFWALQNSAQYSPIPELDSAATVTNEHNLIQLLHEYKTQRTLYLDGLSISGKPKVDFKKYVAVAQNIGKCMHKDAMVSLLIPLLLDPQNGVMVPNHQNRPDTRQKTNISKFSKKSKKRKLQKSADSQNFSNKDFEIQKEYILKLYSPLFDCWFHTWGKNAFMEELTNSILLRLNTASSNNHISLTADHVSAQSSNMYHEMLAHWLLFLIEMYYKTRTSSSIKHRRKLVYSFINLDKILKSSLVSPSRYNQTVLQALVRADNNYSFILPILNFQQNFITSDTSSTNSGNAVSQPTNYSELQLNDLLLQIHSSEKVFQDRLNKIKTLLVGDFDPLSLETPNSDYLCTENTEFVSMFNKYNSEPVLSIPDQKSIKPSPLGCLPNNLLSKLEL